MQELRRRGGWKQGEFAKRLGMDRTTLNKIESGVPVDVKLSQVCAFALELGTSPLHLIASGEDDELMEVTRSNAAGTAMSAGEFRSWFRGAPLPRLTRPVDWFVSLPRSEQRAALTGVFASLFKDDVDRALWSEEIASAVKTHQWFLELPPDEHEAEIERLQSKEKDDG